MKKLICLALAVCLSLSLVGCGGSAIDEMPLADIMTTITEGVDAPATETMELTKDNFSAFLFIDYIENSEALVSESMIGAVAHSVVLLRVDDDADVEAVAEEIKEKMDPRKWICVEAEKSEVLVKGNTILLIMSFADVTDPIVENFNAL